MKPRSSRTQYVALALYVVVSLGYYMAGVGALRETWFHAGSHARVPVDISDTTQRVVSTETEAQSAGIAKGDLVKAINGMSFSGEYQLWSAVRRTQPGSVLTVTVLQSNGQEKNASIKLAPREGPPWSASMFALLLTILLLPLLSLLVGYWVVAARPHDPNAWLVLILLTFGETFFGNLDPRWWLGIWFVSFGFWSILIQCIGMPVLLLFGFRFPEQWRVDARWPWLKWSIVVPQLIALFVELWANYVHSFHISWGNWADLPEFWADRLLKILQPVSIVLFLVAISDKLRSASTADARRRLRVLTLGSIMSLGPLLIAFGLLPYFGFDPHHNSTYQIVVPFFALFPLTLAYVLVVQRAMDVRILLRMGTKYALAKGMLWVLRAVVLALILSLFTKKSDGESSAVTVARFAVLAAVLLVLRTRIFKLLSNSLDRRFFREAYNTEMVLSQLSEEARKYTEKQLLIETVARRISEVLHVPQMAVWVRGSNVFHPQEVIGFPFSESIALSEKSSTVQAITRSNQPVPLYQDNPDTWFAEADSSEKQTLKQMHAALLLGLPGRKQLMGVIALGSKRSEEPYTPSDLRLLQTVAMQTGLALEVSELAESLAKEAAQRARVDREIEIARDVQQRLFPQRMPVAPGISLAGACRPALGVGGDYFDVIELPDKRLGIAIGDVSGKGISAALLMASLRACLRTITVLSSMNLAELMEKMNQLVYESSAVNRYATFFFSIYDPATKALCYVNAGHNPPVVLRASSGEIIRLEAGGPVVGLLPNMQYEEQSITLCGGDLLLTYTDGISEAMTEEDEEWGEERMLQTVQSVQNRSVDEILQYTFAGVDQFTKGAAQHDDMTLLFMKVE